MVFMSLITMVSLFKNFLFLIWSMTLLAALVFFQSQSQFILNYEAEQCKTIPFPLLRDGIVNKSRDPV